MKVSTTHNHVHTKPTTDHDITDDILENPDDVAKLGLRLVIGCLMLFHGVHKLVYGVDPIGELLSNVGLPKFFAFGVFLGEIIAPVLLILGYKVRLAAFLIAADMLIAILLAHSSDVFVVTSQGGWKIELNILYFTGSVALCLLGSGKFALSHGEDILD